MPGIDRNRLIDVSEHNLDDFTCGICLGIFVNPMVTNCCRQTFCSQCIHYWLTQHNTCPFDRQALTVDDLSTPSADLINLLNKIEIKCEFHTNGCEIVIHSNELSNHLEKCIFNPNRKCENCGLIAGTVCSNHNCIEKLKDQNQSFNEEINRLINENSRLREQMETMETIQDLQTYSNRDDRTLKIVESHMSEPMVEFAVSTAYEAHDLFRHESERKLSTYIRDEFEGEYDTLWNCLVSTDVNWGTAINHCRNHYIYFKIGRFHFMIWQMSK